MADLNQRDDVSRRTFLRAGVTAAAVAGMPLDALGEDTKAKPNGPLPQRVLGRTGKKVTILNLGCGREPTPRILNAAYYGGIRCLDTAGVYARGASEKAIAEWLTSTGRRKEFFIVTKEYPCKTPEAWLEGVDKRLEALKTDYIDLFFIHGVGSENKGEGEAEDRDVPKAKEWAQAAEKMKKSGKVHFVGFSTHTDVTLRTELLNKAAEGGWVDAIMTGYDPKLVRDNAEFNKALDACHKAGVGLICMKEMRGVDDMPEMMPKFKEMGLSPYQAVLHAVWTDERIATICSDIANLHVMTENTTAARNFKPMDRDKIGAVIELYERYGTRYCNACDGRCARAAGTKAALGDITRALSYYECDGLRDNGRELYASLTPEQRDWHGADLAAASRACHCNLDFATLLPRAEQKLA